MKRISISHITNRHNDWLRAISFYTDEIGVLKKRLTEVAGKNTDAGMLRQVEHYENQLQIRNDRLERLEHDIRRHLTDLSRQAANAGAGYVDGNLPQQHERLEEEYLQEESVINKLRYDFNRFAAHWM